MVLTKKFLFRGNGPFWGQKLIADPYSSRSALRIFLKFCTVKVSNSYLEIILMAFPKKILFEANGPFRSQNGASSQLWICRQDCFTILHNERGQERHGNYINGFSEKNIILGNLIILAQKWYMLITLDLLSVVFLILHNKRGQELHQNCISCFSSKSLIWGNLIFLGHFLLFDWASSKLSQATVTIGSLNSQDMISFMISTGSLISQDMISILKQLGHDSSSYVDTM